MKNQTEPLESLSKPQTSNLQASLTNSNNRMGNHRFIGCRLRPSSPVPLRLLVLPPPSLSIIGLAHLSRLPMVYTPRMRLSEFHKELQARIEHFSKASVLVHACSSLLPNSKYTAGAGGGGDKIQRRVALLVLAILC